MHYSMRDPTEDSDSCGWSVIYRRDINSHFHQFGSSSPSGRRDLVRRMILDQDAVFKNQLSELHRLYSVQKILMERLMQKKLAENPGNGSTHQRMALFPSGNLECDGLSPARDVAMQNGVRPVKIRRKLIDLQLPAEGYEDHENLQCPLLENRSKPGKEAWEKRFLERQEVASGSCMGLKRFNGFADLNEPVHVQEPGEPVASSKDTYPVYGRNNVLHEQGHDRSSRTESSQIFSDKTFQPPFHPLSEHGMARFSGERTFCDSEARLRNPEVSYDSHVESIVASSVPISHGHHPEFVLSWAHRLSSRDKPNSSSVQMNPYLNSNPKGRANPSFEISPRDFSGLCQGLIPAEILQEQKQHNKECSTGLSWLKPKPHCRSEITNGCLDLNATIHHQFTDETEMGDGFTNASAHQSSRSIPCSDNAGIGRDDEMADLHRSRKILGFPVFEKYCIVKKEPSFITSPSAYTIGRSIGEDKMVKRDLNINSPCDDSVSVTDHGDAEAATLVDREEEGKRAFRFRHDIDLNICASEDEDSVMPSALIVKRKAIPWIDLEAPAVLDSEDEAEKTNGDTRGLLKGKDGNFMDELQLLEAAAEAIVAISLSDPDEAVCSSINCPVKNPLAWFADTIVSYDDDSGKKIIALSEGRHSEGGREECSSGEFDYFEAMTLNLMETKEEDYMPMPLVPENLRFEEMGITATTPNRPRRGQPRRGRPKRDFQRDILPGLTSLTRQEVTEDLQMFGGLKKATGYPRNPSRCGSNRGRKRPVSSTNRAMSCSLLKQSLMNHQVEKSGPEDRSFKGWGMATRRPRRRRCPAANHPPTVILT
ncbi:PREDICTED: uncharacterized protein LOC104822024 [Tarenaya hassleriana]|uniref:uncharacterized protein LOC104822024 n=1 Tax=Tarenaya hassleriana TaxID=28532 RepID=UPI00053C0CBC|nr:PREDICTED: uncharacterized protein LOC104822024 [Tarenaya hassleriana]XP_010551401.1 PREDICTED: uncharacterized protein LOC104822024 [Tarenaya hassleriana]XP_010551402.1 PREDICTED: uncharacterized protein LOC104822024 [Tarenaya hassleriana]